MRQAAPKELAREAVAAAGSGTSHSGRIGAVTAAVASGAVSGSVTPRISTAHHPPRVVCAPESAPERVQPILEQRQLG